MNEEKVLTPSEKVVQLAEGYHYLVARAKLTNKESGPYLVELNGKQHSITKLFAEYHSYFTVFSLLLSAIRPTQGDSFFDHMAAEDVHSFTQVLEPDILVTTEIFRNKHGFDVYTQLCRRLPGSDDLELLDTHDDMDRVIDLDDIVGEEFIKSQELTDDYNTLLKRYANVLSEFYNAPLADFEVGKKDETIRFFVDSVLRPLSDNRPLLHAFVATAGEGLRVVEETGVRLVVRQPLGDPQRRYSIKVGLSFNSYGFSGWRFVIVHNEDTGFFNQERVVFSVSEFLEPPSSAG